jgi:hypothetical protein
MHSNLAQIGRTWVAASLIHSYITPEPLQEILSTSTIAPFRAPTMPSEPYSLILWTRQTLCHSDNKIPSKIADQKRPPADTARYQMKKMNPPSPTSTKVQPNPHATIYSTSTRPTNGGKTFSGETTKRQNDTHYRMDDTHYRTEPTPLSIELTNSCIQRGTFPLSTTAASFSPSLHATQKKHPATTARYQLNKMEFLSPATTKLQLNPHATPYFPARRYPTVCNTTSTCSTDGGKMYSEETITSLKVTLNRTEPTSISVEQTNSCIQSGTFPLNKMAASTSPPPHSDQKRSSAPSARHHLNTMEPPSPTTTKLQLHQHATPYFPTRRDHATQRKLPATTACHQSHKMDISSPVTTKLQLNP